MKRKILFILVLIFIGIIGVIGLGIIPRKIKMIQPESAATEIATNQLFIFEPIESGVPRRLSGCLYFPNLYDAKGERIMTAQGRRGSQVNARFMELDSINNVKLNVGEPVTLKITADCLLLGIEVLKIPIFEKKYIVSEKVMSTEEKITIQEKMGVDPTVLNAMQEMEDTMKKIEEEEKASKNN